MMCVAQDAGITAQHSGSPFHRKRFEANDLGIAVRWIPDMLLPLARGPADAKQPQQEGIQ